MLDGIGFPRPDTAGGAITFSIKQKCVKQRGRSPRRHLGGCFDGFRRQKRRCNWQNPLRLYGASANARYIVAPLPSGHVKTRCHLLVPRYWHQKNPRVSLHMRQAVGLNQSVPTSLSVVFSY